MPSSVVGETKYDKLSHTLSVVYVSGMVYDYQSVPEEIYVGMKAAFSKGTFLGKYEFKKIEK